MTAAEVGALRRHVREIPDFPRPGVSFKDITPLFAQATALRSARDALARHASSLDVDLVISAEARGFVLGGAVASEIGAGFVVARKPGRLPREAMRLEYELEYGTDSLEVHRDALPAGSRVLVHDDLLATGGTASALCGLVQRADAVVAGCAFVIELSFLDGRERLAPHTVHSLLQYGS